MYDVIGFGELDTPIHPVISGNFDITLINADYFDSYEAVERLSQGFEDRTFILYSSNSAKVEELRVHFDENTNISVIEVEESIKPIVNELRNLYIE